VESVVLELKRPNRIVAFLHSKRKVKRVRSALGSNSKSHIASLLLKRTARQRKVFCSRILV
jgi:hypothetical protein